GGYQVIRLGGVANDTVIKSNGSQDVFFSGQANNTVISAGAENVWSGGTASGANLESNAATLTVNNGGHSFQVEIVVGTEIVSSGGRASSTFCATSSGSLIVLSG